MKIVITLLLCLASVLPTGARSSVSGTEASEYGPFLQLSPEAPLVHSSSRFEFPLDIGCFHRALTRQYDQVGEDVSVTYYGCGSVTLTLYVYPEGRNTLEQEFEARQAEITSTRNGAKLVGTSRIQLTTHDHPALSAAFLFDSIFEGKIQPHNSELVLAKYNTRFVKYRFTYPASLENSAAPAIKAFKHQFQWP